jgi:hypothetical protein
MAANAAAPDKQPPVLPSVEASQKCGAIDRTGCVAAGHIDEADCAAPIQPAHQRNLTPAEWTRAVVLDGQFSHVSAPEIVCHSASNSLAGGRNAAKWPLPPTQPPRRYQPPQTVVMAVSQKFPPSKA